MNMLFAVGVDRFSDCQYTVGAPAATYVTPVPVVQYVAPGPAVSYGSHVLVYILQDRTCWGLQVHTARESTCWVWRSFKVHTYLSMFVGSCAAYARTDAELEDKNGYILTGSVAFGTAEQGVIIVEEAGSLGSWSSYAGTGATSGRYHVHRRDGDQ